MDADWKSRTGGFILIRILSQIRSSDNMPSLEEEYVIAWGNAWEADIPANVPKYLKVWTCGKRGSAHHRKY